MINPVTLLSQVSHHLLRRDGQLLAEIFKFYFDQGNIYCARSQIAVLASHLRAILKCLNHLPMNNYARVLNTSI